MLAGDRLARKGRGREAGSVGVDTEFLLQLPDERGLGSLPIFDLAAREFPESRHAAMRRPLLEENPAFSVHECGGDDDHCRIFFQRNDFP